MQNIIEELHMSQCVTTSIYYNHNLDTSMMPIRYIELRSKHLNPNPNR
jgi:hypothetical protein